MTTSDTHETPSSTRPDPLTAPPERDPEVAKKRGFAKMSREEVRELARKGGRQAHANGTAHRFNAELAKTAGRKGGLASQALRSNLVPKTEKEGVNE